MGRFLCYFIFELSLWCVRACVHFMFTEFNRLHLDNSKWIFFSRSYFSLFPVCCCCRRRRRCRLMIVQSVWFRVVKSKESNDDKERTSNKLLMQYLFYTHIFTYVKKRYRKRLEIPFFFCIVADRQHVALHQNWQRNSTISNERSSCILSLGKMLVFRYIFVLIKRSLSSFLF